MQETKYTRIDKQELEFLVEHGYSITKLAKLYEVSRPTVYKAIAELGLEIKKELKGKTND